MLRKNWSAILGCRLSIACQINITCRERRLENNKWRAERNMQILFDGILVLQNKVN